MIVGLVGLKGSGKTTASRYLRDSKNFVIVPFASPIKSMLWVFLHNQNVSNSIIDKMLNGDLKETPSEYFSGRTPRFAMQTLGTEWGRDLISPNLWTDTWARYIISLNNVVVDDVRFQSEIDRIRSLGGICIRINRPDAESDPHSSEAGIKDLHDLKYTVENDQGFVDLYEQLRLIMDIEKFNDQREAQLSAGLCPD
jgi:hypothetical protein